MHLLDRVRDQTAVLHRMVAYCLVTWYVCCSFCL